MKVFLRRTGCRAPRPHTSRCCCSVVQPWPWSCRQNFCKGDVGGVADAVVRQQGSLGLDGRFSHQLVSDCSAVECLLVSCIVSAQTSHADITPPPVRRRKNGRMLGCASILPGRRGGGVRNDSGRVLQDAPVRSASTQGSSRGGAGSQRGTIIVIIEERHAGGESNGRCERTKNRINLASSGCRSPLCCQ